MGLTGKEMIAARCAKFFKDGDFVNLGIGIPNLCVNFLPEGVDIWLETEIGAVGSGPTPKPEDWDLNIVTRVIFLRHLSKEEASVICSVHSRLYEAGILMRLFSVRSRLIRKEVLPIGRFPANLCPAWAEQWIFVLDAGRSLWQQNTMKKAEHQKY